MEVIHIFILSDGTIFSLRVKQTSKALRATLGAESQAYYQDAQ